MTAAILLFLIGLHVVTSSYVNSANKPFAFQCSPGYSINSIQSTPFISYKDRGYAFTCHSTSGLSTSCTWYSNANSYGGFLLFQCPSNRVITGVISQHNRSYRDRRFQFRCCYITGGKKLTSCSFSSSQNYYGSSVNYKISSGRVLRGAISLHSPSPYYDRLWRFEVCRLS